ncbi:MAG: hypothetical protein AB1425_10430 [Actinomycetota bacterium]
MRAATPTLAELRAVRDRARTEYLAVARTTPRDTAERAQRWREFLEANAAYLRAKGETR